MFLWIILEQQAWLIRCPKIPIPRITGWIHLSSQQFCIISSFRVYKLMNVSLLLIKVFLLKSYFWLNMRLIEPVKITKLAKWPQNLRDINWLFASFLIKYKTCSYKNNLSTFDALNKTKGIMRREGLVTVNQTVKLLKIQTNGAFDLLDVYRYVLSSQPVVLSNTDGSTSET